MQSFAAPTPMVYATNPVMQPVWTQDQLILPPPLEVCVKGLSFQYQFTEDDVKKVFSRYGDVVHVIVNPEGSVIHVTFSALANAMAAWSDLNGKQLAGIAGAYLSVTCPTLKQHASTGGLEAFTDAQNRFWVMQSTDQSGKKYTCRLEVGIENDKEFRVGSKVIQIARKIWQELPAFKDNGGKTRLRGKGVGGPHESDEPLALCISCRDATCFEQAVQFAEAQIGKIHNEYVQFCSERNWPAPVLKRCVAVCDHPHTTAPWHQSKFDHHWGGQQRLSRGARFPRNDEIHPNNNNNNNNWGEDHSNKGPRPAGAPTDQEIEKFIEERNEARKGGNFHRADEIRDHLKNRGVVLMDDKGARGNKYGREVTKWRYWNP